MDKRGCEADHSKVDRLQKTLSVERKDGKTEEVENHGQIPLPGLYATG